MVPVRNTWYIQSRDATIFPSLDAYVFEERVCILWSAAEQTKTLAVACPAFNSGELGLPQSRDLRHGHDR